MNFREVLHLLIAVLVISLVISFPNLITSNWQAVPISFLFAFLIIGFNVFAKKAMAYSLDSNVEHSLWGFSKWGFLKQQHFNQEFPAGIFVPLFSAIFLSLFSLERIFVLPILTYEAVALKTRAAKRFGYYSYTTLSEWHNSLIGAAGIIAVLLLSLIAYFLPFGWGELSRAAAFFAFFNLLPISKLDGTQIFFGSRVLWSILFAISFIFIAFAAFAI